MENQTSRAELVCAISRISFIMDDLRLFLDTHPGNAEAIAYYNECQRTRKHLLHEYTSRFGGMTSYCPNEHADTWMWNCQPMPWEGV